MNPIYYTTAEELHAVIDYLNKNQIGGGVEGVDPETFVGPVSIPRVEGKEMVQVLLANGCRMQAGLVFDTIRRYGPESWLTKSMLEANARGSR